MNNECPKCKGLKVIYQKNPDCDNSCACTIDDCDGYGGNICTTPSKCFHCNGTGKQPEAPEIIYLIPETSLVNSERRNKSDIEYIRKDKAACCGNCQEWTTNGGRQFCGLAIIGVLNFCDKWELRK
ncbi:MAG: hypothetical protein GY804_02660 [Alphaproteobacteria bacterium]|nr:hypothetical protein [Alphaproteobacteria bacterium]